MDGGCRRALSVLVCGSLFACGAFAGCRGGVRAPEPVARPPAEARGESVRLWVTHLQTSYRRKRLPGYLEAKKRFRRESRHLVEDPDYDLVSMVLGLDETAITVKEAELAARLRRLAARIEANPGNSLADWRALRNTLVSYEFGNHRVDPASIAWEVLELYRAIATGSFREIDDVAELYEDAYRE